ncbi:MAG TPA: amino acid adenylation domain-containing protein [Archangium sp.]|uniref:non-ribosomal peptide synthetase n=1 Tax=Archangium sp. TaxID=1872627 RepID=UPI002E3768AA|nr:non-ribosomal peptide synthetase [Archangium sp.]HEX5745893.1 amino acid adenylation domain-containing protein [Archangium sp.]
MTPVPRTTEATAARPSSTPDDVRVVPAAVAQRRLWVMDQFEPGSSFYNLSTSLRLPGTLDAAVLERGLDELLRRHEVLRTTFASVDGTPIQRISPPRPFALSIIDLSHLPPAERQAEASRLATQEAGKPFELSTAPLIRGTLLRLGEQEHQFLLTLHHTISDVRSLGVLLRELRTTYDALAAGQPAPLPEPSTRYEDFVRWQQEFLHGEAVAGLLDWWRKQLAGVPNILELPTDRPRGTVQRQERASHSVTLPASLTRGLEALAQREDATLFMTLLTGFSTLLHRYSGQEDVVVGARVSGRTRPELENVVGPIANTLALRNNLSGSPRFVELLARVREVTRAALAHQELPFETLVEAIQPERNLGHAPIFQVMFDLQDALTASAGAPVIARSAKTDLTLFMARTAEGLSATFDYDIDLYDAERIQRMAGHFQLLLESAVARPSQSISSLPIIPEAEWRTLREWNSATFDFPRDRCVHEIFSQQAALTPDAPAVTYGPRSFTYRELDERSNQLARHLRAQGVGPEVLVGLCVDRSVDLILGIMGILKAGGAYLPLDSAYPAERLAFMLEDASVSVLLVHQDKLRRLPAFSGPIVRLDADADLKAIGRESAEPLPPTACPDNLAYVIYTSGSTGRPKGSAIYHRTIFALVDDKDLHPFGPKDRVAQTSNISFDPSVFEIWGALTHGSHLMGMTADPARAPEDFTAQVRDQAISVMFCSTAVLNLLARQYPATFRNVDTLFFGGEAADPTALRELFKHGPPRRLVNGYGPTECTVFSTYYDVATPPPAGSSVPIGRSLGNGAIYILDKHMQHVPIGVPGELYVAGERLGRGYFNRPDLTARIYVPDPFSSTPGARLYKTGDLGRFLPDGRIEYLGRIDHQVKIRGFRVELGEIEEQLRLHSSVKDCTVQAVEAGGDRKIAAWFVPRENAAPTASELRSFLRERLPEHMLPASFTTLSELPLTPNGKVDRRALPAPDTTRGDEDSYQPPSTPTEKTLARLWSSLLELEQVSVHDNFFHLGGHSLLATQLLTRVNETFRLQLPLRRIFEAPTLAQQAEVVEATLRNGATDLRPELRPIPRGGDLQISSTQERIWLMEQLHPGNLAYRILVSYRITSPLDVAVLQRSLDELLRRHEALRTLLVATGEGVPVQRIAPPGPFSLLVTDLSHLPPAEREAEAARMSLVELHRTLDVTTGPLIHGTLLRLGEQEHQLLITVHHIVSDGWSLRVMMPELRTLYGDFAAGRPSSLPEFPLQYADFAAWQRQWLKGETLDQLLAYWKKQLAGAPAILALPTDRPRPPVHRYKGDILTIRLGETLTRAIENLGREKGVTLFMTLLAGFNVLMQRYSGQDDIVVGSPMAGRIQPGLERIIGMFINTLVLRSDLSGDPTFVELLGRVRETTLGAYSNQEMPFEKLVEDIQPERTLSHSPIVQVTFVLQSVPTLEADPSAPLQMTATAEPWELYSGASKSDLTLFMARYPEGLSATFEYDTDLFDRERIQRMAEHFQMLLEAAVAQPAQPISSLPILTDAERRTLREWNSGTRDFPRDRCVHELFSQQAARTPDAPAVTYGPHSLTYRQLDERSNQLARHLRSQGVGPEVLVGLCVDRSVDLVVSILGILKAGGAYLPLDSSYPSERLAFMLEDASVSVLLVHQDKLQRLPAFSGPVVRLDSDSDREAIRGQSAEPLPPAACPDNLAYVIYTSGSTGRPKGSAIFHRGICALSYDRDFHPFSPTDRVAQASNASFDPSTFEIWGALLHGAHLVGITADPARAPEDFTAQVRDQGITVMFVTTAVLNLLARQYPATFQNVHTLVFGGEAADPLALREIFKHGPPRRLVNGYGPTECTVFSSFHPVASPPPVGLPVPIGRPLSNGPLYILDKRLQHVPVGVPGELYVAGERLGRGYFNRPELTARIYVPDPFSATPGARMYKTGDLARFLPDGRIEYLGRIDHQVKIRGFRVELGEIEEQLRLHPGVKDCTVQAVEVGGDRKLAAWFVPREQAPTASELRAFLRERLPEHMLPASFTELAALPLTPNGKVDRRALPSAEPTRSDDHNHVPPRTPTEEALCRIWAALLEVARVGIHDNFFHLGGHSLLATQLISRIRTEFGVQLPLRLLFTGPTVAEMAQHLGERPGQVVPVVELQRAIPPLVHAPRGGSLAVSFTQERFWRFFQRAPESSAYNIPCAFRLRGRVDPRAMRGAFQALIARHESLRATFFEEQGRLRQRISDSVDFQMREVDLRGRENGEDEARKLMAEGAARPFDLTRGPLLHATLMRLADEDSLLFFCVHHIASDGWSMGVMARELGALYSALVDGREPELPPLRFQYPDYAAWQRSWLAGEELEQRLGYWKKALAGAPTELALPTDKPSPPTRTFQGTYRDVVFGRERSAALHALCQQERVTPYMAILSALGTVLARRSGQEEVVIGSPIANRLLSDVEPLIGIFVNGLALRVDLRGTPGFRELLRRVREETLGAFAHQEVPIDLVAATVAPQSPPNRSPLFQVMFVLQNAPESPLEMKGLTVQPYGVDRGNVTYELALSLQETSEGFAGVLEFNTDLFAPATGESIRSEVIRLLDAVLANPELPVGPGMREV